jgi:biotin carboxylase
MSAIAGVSRFTPHAHERAVAGLQEGFVVHKILFVYGRGGTPPGYLLPQIAEHAELHLLALAPLPEADRDDWEVVCASITAREQGEHDGDALVTLITEHARRLEVQAITTASEFLVVAVAESARRLGLRGAGPQVGRARDKRLMRRIWADAGVPVPDFRAVADLDELRAAAAELNPPLLLKAAWSAGSIGQYLLHDATDAAAAWAAGTEAIETARKAEFGEFRHRGAGGDWLVEEVIVGSTEGWYDQSVAGYGDYVSVEGIVDGGVYHPICLTGRMPSLPPFTEPANLAPCVLPESRQRQIEALARKAVDALELETCGTHTEIKLVPGGAYVIETAARFGGCMLVREVADVVGFDLVGGLVAALLGEPVDYPEQMIVTGQGAAASLALIASDAAGRPWRHQRIWDDRAVDWASLLPAGTTVEVVKQMTLKPNTPIPPYDPAAGALNWAGIFYVRAPDAASLLSACNRVLDGMEHQLPRVDAPAEVPG